MYFLNKIISRLKGESFVLDKRIPLVYLVGFLCTRFVTLIWGMLRLHTLRLVFVHPSSVIKCSSKIHYGKNLSIGRDCYVDALSIRGLDCGDNVSIGFHSHIELTGSLKNIGQGMKVGNNVGLGSHGHYGSGMGFFEIGNDTIFGNYVSVHPENHNYQDLSKPIRLQGVSGKGVKIGNNCWIGAKVTILDGTIIGNNSIVAAGAVVSGVFPDNAVLGGVPAKIIKNI